MNTFWEKWEKVFLWIFIALVPTQLGKHFWLNWSQVMGIRVDYLAVIVYLNDLVWIAWMGMRLINGKWKRDYFRKNNFEKGIVLILIVLNVVVAKNIGVAIYRWLRFWQWYITYKVVRADKKEVGEKLGQLLPWWIVIESMLGWAQLTKSGSINGWWWWLGERRFDFLTIGVAQMSILGNGLVRAYGTFSHPNSMAGFLLVCMVWWMEFVKNKSWWWWVVSWSGLVGIMVSGSRMVWLMLAGYLIMRWWKLWKNKEIFWGSVLAVMGVVLIVMSMVRENYVMADYMGGWDSESLGKRLALNVAAGKMWSNSLMLGVGAGNFMVNLVDYQKESQFYWLQPVHNIFLLVGSELGVLGILLIIWMLGKNMQMSSLKKWWIVWVVVWLTGMVDHYWITLPQNWWLMGLMMGLM